jgi:hypothetical protein|tara:strand:+ start:232 stop:1254 length:1023 start_codon:yes stop_codon:yes gene_type:complete
MRHAGTGGEGSPAERELPDGECFALTRLLIGAEAWAFFSTQQEGVLKWMADPLNVERANARWAEATRESHARTVREFIGHAVRTHDAEPSLSTLLDGNAVMRYLLFQRARGLKPKTMVKTMTHLNTVLRVMRSSSGRQLLSPPLSDSEVQTCGELRDQISALSAQLWGEEPKRPPPTPEERVAAGDWPAGGHATLQAVALQRASTVLGTATSMLELPAHSPSVVATATHVNQVMMALLVTQLPTPRPRSLYTLTCKGVTGVLAATSGRYCSIGECKLPSCRGNTLERRAPRSYVLVTSHHKTERRVSVPDAHISAAAGSTPVLLDLLELVRVIYVAGAIN